MPPRLKRITRPSSKILLKAGFAFILLLVLVGSTLGYAYVNRQRQLSKLPVACPNDVMQKAAKILAGTNYNQLGQLIPEIKKVPNYNRSPDCLYIVVSYDIAISDSKRANEDFSKLQLVYKKEKGFSPLLGGKYISFDSLKSSTEVLSVAVKQSANNSRTFPNEP